MERYLCIHGHFYQPPRENPWLEAIEIQDSAFPYHDWNERITAECYEPNSASRILNGDGYVSDIVSNYSKISFNFGPTLLSWLIHHNPDVYEAVLQADKESMKARAGHGNAIAQVYNHIIMPLAAKRDKLTQIVWGIRDFEHRFKRFPEGMWLAETAVDYETLDLMAKQGIRFVVLAPHQALKVRRVGSGRWRDVSGSRIDPTRAYLCRLSSRRRINIFFYDGPISKAVAFEGVLNRGEDFAGRMMTGFSDSRDWPQLLSIATDGETFGHHHTFGDMALAYVLNYVESRGLARLTNYGEYLEKYPATHEVQIQEGSSWSCAHGIERWRSDCGCNSGNKPGWNQQWRKPLRQTFDWLRDELAELYEKKACAYLKDPWGARDDYIEILLDRSDENTDRYLGRHALNIPLDKNGKRDILKLLEMQRQTLLMYTSCGWFFDEISGLETVQVLQYAGRALQLAEDISGDTGFRKAFLERIAEAKSNIPEQGDGASIYNAFVQPAIVDLKKVGVHYAISSLFEDYPDRASVYTYSVFKEDYSRTDAGATQLAMGKIMVVSQITREAELLSFSVLNLGRQVLNGGVRTFLGDDAYGSMKEEISATFDKSDYAETMRMMDRHFGMHNYSFPHLFRDQQRKILGFIVKKTLDDIEHSYRGIYEQNRGLMGLLREGGMPVPDAFLDVAGFVLNQDMRRIVSKKETDVNEARSVFTEMQRWGINVDGVSIEYDLRRNLRKMMKRFYEDPSNITCLTEIRTIIELASVIHVTLNLWHAQNIYYRVTRSLYAAMLERSERGEPEALTWIDVFQETGKQLRFDLSALLSNVVNREAV